MNNKLKDILSYVLIIVGVILFRTFIATPIIVEGPSMMPTLHENNLLILNKIDKTYKRMDIVVFKYNDDELIKRIIGLPGEKVEFKNSKLYINDNQIKDYSDNTNTNDYSTLSMGIEKIPDGYYFVMGDNRNNSTDSRIIGLVKKTDIKGTVNFRLFKPLGLLK